MGDIPISGSPPLTILPPERVHSEGVTERSGNWAVAAGGFLAVAALALLFRGRSRTRVSEEVQIRPVGAPLGRFGRVVPLSSPTGMNSFTALRTAGAAATATAALSTGGCSEPRELEWHPGDPPRHIYRTVKPILEENCVFCHSGEEPDGNYDLSTYVRVTRSAERYNGLLGLGTDPVRNAIAGNPQSLLLTTLRRGDHASYLTEDEQERLIHWIERDRLARFWISGIHPPGWLNPADNEFHGQYLAENNYWHLGPDRSGTVNDSPSCSHCHGNDDEEGGRYGGGGVALGFGDEVQSCVQCHGGSPEGCTTCHGTGLDQAPPRPLRWAGSLGAGAHQIHLNGSERAEPIICSDCHTVPEHFSDPDHIDTDRPAEVILQGLALHNGTLAAWDRIAATCNAYCHTPNPNDNTRTSQTSPRWDTTQHATCTTCHGTPPGGDHPVTSTCSVCHPTVVRADRTILSSVQHVDGEVQTGPDGIPPEETNCLTCHDLSPESIDPRALDWEGSMGIAAHTAHLTGNSRHSALECVECHHDYDEFSTPGHVDSELPAEVPFPLGGLARTNGFVPTWNRSDPSCTAYCHSPSLGDIHPSPAWDDSNVVVTCITCHETPPPAPHPPVEDCSACHETVVNPDQTIASPSNHVNGGVEIGIDGVSLGAATCYSCHNLSAGTPAPRALNWSGSFGVAAHMKHLESWLMQPMTCGECHTNPPALFAPGHIDTNLPAEVPFPIGSRARANGSTPVWDRASGTCSTSYCHPGTSPRWDDPDAVVGCSSCHGAPPPPPHPQANGLAACFSCHGQVLDNGNHLNGHVDFF